VGDENIDDKDNGIDRKETTMKVVIIILLVMMAV
jgi:hypothetical protein